MIDKSALSIAADRSRSDSRENMIDLVDIEPKKQEHDEKTQWLNDTTDVELSVLPGNDEEFVPTKESIRKPHCFCLHPYVCCCCVFMLGLSWKIKVPIVLGLVVFVVWSILSFDFNTCLFSPIKIEPLPEPSLLLPYGRQPPTAAAKQSHGFVLTLLGNLSHDAFSYTHSPAHLL